MFTTKTSASGPRVRTVLAIALGIGALAIPASAGAYYGSVTESGQPTGSESTDTGLVIPDHTALNESLAPGGGAAGSIEVPSPTPVIDTPAPIDGFDWGDAALGAGMTMALIALGGATVLTLRRIAAISPSAG